MKRSVIFLKVTKLGSIRIVAEIQSSYYVSPCNKLQMSSWGLTWAPSETGKYTLATLEKQVWMLPCHTSTYISTREFSSCRRCRLACLRPDIQMSVHASRRARSRISQGVSHAHPYWLPHSSKPTGDLSTGIFSPSFFRSRLQETG